ncbi:uncharacterized protein C14orf132 isoform X2 [Lepisosteus oculatus]|uniref:uncharacterized protein C14orf132 isoform X2 n=1 Tax=Lepisosteus oculatus TaxID=7918 RepID=UPI003723E45E
MKWFLTDAELLRRCSRERARFVSRQHFPAVSGAFLDSPYNGNTSLQTSTSNLEASFARPPEPEEEPKISSDAIWLWIAIIATIGNVVVVAVVCACTF